MRPETLHNTFLGLPPEKCAYDSAQVVLVQVPYDGTCSYEAGTRNGPAAIMAASRQVETFDLELGFEPCQAGIHALPELLPTALGPQEMVDQVEAYCGRPLDDGKFVFTLGGEHTVALGPVRALARRQQEPFGVLQIDAHLDLRESYEGSRFSHACVARRILDEGCAPLVQVGVRVGCPEELAAAQDHAVVSFWGPEIAPWPDEKLIQEVLRSLPPRVYVTLDVDGLDPSVVPGTGTPVPGGLGWYRTLALLRAVGQQRQVVGCDLCELSPQPSSRASEFAAAMLVYKMIGFFTNP